MKYLIYALLVPLLIPLQVLGFDRLSIGGIRPDLSLVAVSLIGLHMGEMEAVTVGAALGFTQDLLSGSLLWGNLCLKPLVGLLAGLARRNLVNLTLKFVFALLLALSVLSGSVMFLLKSLTGPGADFFAAARETILPQACYDAVLGTVVLMLMQRWGPARQSYTVTTNE
jgi:rod shape-determining protein MreD